MTTTQVGFGCVSLGRAIGCATVRASCRRLIAPVAAVLAVLAGTQGTQDAVANGDTRTLSIIQDHTKDSATVTFKRNGSYDPEALKQLNWLLRDWRLDEQTRMDPRLFDVVWEVYREVGSQEPIHVVSGYRSPETNAMLRRRSRVVAEHSQHMRGKAMDFYLPDVSMSRVREVGMRIQDGGVGFYPNAYNPFVHLDVGSVRAWPRMSRDQLARLFPSGRTVHIPRDGKPMPGYEEAKAEILAKGGSVAGYTTYAEADEEGGGRKSLWAMLFGGGGSDDEDSDFYGRRPARGGGRAPANAAAFVASSGNSDDGGTRGLFARAPEPEPVRQPASRGRRAGTEVASLAVTDASLEPTPAPGAPSMFLQPASSAGVARLRDEPVAQSVQVLSAVPVPPRRPGDLDPLIVAAPLPPVRPVAQLAFVGSAPVLPNELRGQMRMAAAAPPRGAVAAGDERAALRALFAAAVTPMMDTRATVTTSRVRPQPLAATGSLAEPSANVRVVFSSARTDLTSDRFSGPAVAPLPILR